ncbi:hypothetical protein ACFQ4C_25665 [Larkinella insperata]|uniref:Uncharacterized protein n=1 Tax=Larkinella insperata TaxID=332158 RepID=A0ABW3QM06_9BACT|nr:hypothetical protein [Larkinella insperata]
MQVDTAMPLLTRSEKIKLLASALQGTMTPKQISDFRQSQEPIYLTLNLGDEARPQLQDPDQPTFHIEIYRDGTSKSYDRYPDGRIVYRT